MLALKQSSQSSGKKRPPSPRGKVTLQSELATGWLLPDPDTLGTSQRAAPVSLKGDFC